MNGHGADTLGERGGASDVDEQKKSFLPARPMVPADDPIAQGPSPDDLTYLEQEDHGAGDRERKDDGDELRGSAPEGHMDEPGSWLDDVDEDDHRSIDERLDQECDKERGLLHRSPQSQTSSEDLEEADGRTQEEAMDRPDEDSKPRRSVGRDVEQGAVGASEEHAGGHDPAQKLEAPPGPDSHGVPSTPLDSRPSARLHNAGSEGPSPGSTRGQRARR